MDTKTNPYALIYSTLHSCFCSIICIFETLKNERIMEKRNTFNVLFYLKKHRTNNLGENPIYLRITANGQRAEMSMHISIAD
jgi:hypothetical protein